MTPSFHTTLSIPFHLTDAAGILFYGHIFTLAHQAFEQFVVQQLSVSWKEWFQNPDWSVPIRHAEADYHNPILAGEECRIEILVTSYSTSSFTLTTTFHQNQLCSTVKTVHVFCQKNHRQKISIPNSLLLRLKNS